jgi:hypothetical protein
LGESADETAGKTVTTITVTAIIEPQNDEGIVVDIIDVLVSNAALTHTMVPSRLFKKTVQQGRSE